MYNTLSSQEKYNREKFHLRKIITIYTHFIPFTQNIIEKNFTLLTRKMVYG